jgi:shikimate dehydrogenase
MNELNEFHYSFRKDHFEKIREFNANILDEHINSSENFIVVYDDLVLKGYCNARIKTRMRDGKTYRYLYVEEIFVKKEYRNQGIAKELLTHISDVCYEQGIFTIELMVWAFNQEALNFYNKLGFVNRSYILENNIQNKE